MRLLGVSAYYHDSAACLVEDGGIVAAAQEERFSRKKHDAGFPHHAVALLPGGRRHRCAGRARGSTVSSSTTSRCSSSTASSRPTSRWRRAACARSPWRVPLWLREKLWIPPRDPGGAARSAASSGQSQIYFTEHHESHAASAFYPVAVRRGGGPDPRRRRRVGDDHDRRRRGQRLRLLEEIAFPHSLGLLYSAFTYFTGFKVNSGEYKLMGLAPYGEPVYADVIRRELIDLRADGSFRLDMDYFGYLDGLAHDQRRASRACSAGRARRPESRDRPARDGPRGLDPDGDRGDRARARAARARR